MLGQYQAEITKAKTQGHMLKIIDSAPESMRENLKSHKNLVVYFKTTAQSLTTRR